MELTERDYLILGVVHKFRFCFGRHVMAMTGFNGQRAADKRLRTLVESGYLGRKKYLYGTPYLYTLTHKGRILLGVNKRAEKIRVERITHDVYVIESAIYFINKYRIFLGDIESEKELHIKDGFGVRKHQPDFAFTHNSKSYAIEVELSPKAKERQEKNILDNYLNYDVQIWITDDKKVNEQTESFKNVYSNLELLSLEEVRQNIGK